MVLGIGSDIVEIQRVERLLKRFDHRFLTKILTPFERRQYHTSSNPVAFCAKRFAAKEAALKALGTGLSQGLSWQHIEVRNHDQGRPLLSFSHKALAYLNALTPLNYKSCLHLSLSDTASFAQAFVVIDCYKEIS